MRSRNWVQVVLGYNEHLEMVSEMRSVMMHDEPQIYCEI